MKEPVPCPHCGYTRPCLGATDGRCIGGRDDLRRQFLGEVVSVDLHPAPWSVFVGRGFRGEGTRAFYVLDANRKCVAEFEDAWTARQVVDLWNARG